MKIAVLDGYTLNPGDLSWAELESLGECTIYERTSPDNIVQRAKDTQIVLTNKTPLNRETIIQLSALKYIGVLATGFNIVDIHTAAEKNIPVCNVPAYGTLSVAQMVFAHILNLTQSVSLHNQLVKKGQWSRSKDFCFWEKPLSELGGKTIGIVGFGRIGQKVAQIAAAFDMNVLIFDTQTPENLPDYVRNSTLQELLKKSDFISLHCPLTKENEKMINSERLSLMKKSAVLINTSRGPLIDESALAIALNSDKIAAACLDVLSAEPPDDKNPLLNAKNCYVTPHIAWATKEARQRLLNQVVQNLKSFMDGKIINCVNF